MTGLNRTASGNCTVWDTCTGMNVALIGLITKIWYAQNMSMHRYTTISFDVGYTLIEPLQEAPEVVATLLHELRIAWDEAALEAAYRRAERVFLEDYLRPLGDTWEADERIQRFYVRYYKQVLADLGVDDRDGQYARTLIERYLDPANWRLYPDVPETLDILREQGYRLGVASDWVSGLTRILHDLQLSRYMEWAVVSGAIGFAKPSPQFYQLIVQRAGVPAREIVHVGDSYYADVRGARTAGIDGILLDRYRRMPKLDVPVIHDLTALPALLTDLKQ
jgi:putative hydrolase of the HAD superfamily